jgi:hypothetical protein
MSSSGVSLRSSRMCSCFAESRAKASTSPLFQKVNAAIEEEAPSSITVFPSKGSRDSISRNSLQRTMKPACGGSSNTTLRLARRWFVSSVQDKEKPALFSPPRNATPVPSPPIFWESMAAHHPPYGGGLNFAISKSPVAFSSLVSTTLLRCRAAGVSSMGNGRITVTDGVTAGTWNYICRCTVKQS